MSKKLQKEYNNLVKTKAILSDQEQLEVLANLEKLKNSIEANEKRFFKKKYEHSGLYIYGGVGRGKSLLMDMFFQHVNVKKRRVHFHEFMSEIHIKLHILRREQKDLSDPIDHLSKEYSKLYKLICFDEFQVTDIVDAMILEKLFKSLFSYGVIIVTTSNRHPKDLYKGGLQREKYLAFVEYVSDRMKILNLCGKKDYRSEHISKMEKTYFFPLSSTNVKIIDKLFNELTGNSTASEHIIRNLGRDLKIAKAASSTAIIDFNEFCKGNYSASDYQAIAKEFSTIFFINIPILHDRNEAKRLVNFIDIMYDKHLNIIFLAEDKVQNLYPKGDGKFEFSRTISRITEMQTERYIN